MKRLAFLLFCVLTGFAAPSQARVQVSFDFFFNTLSPYGEWVTAGTYGNVWRPAGVDVEWTPYSDGYWSYTDAGWTWVSYEDWGGITYHYGRWVRLDDYGWCWVPGYDWGPAWVSWRRSDDYIGWAPLPPEARWSASTGFGIWVDTYFDIGPGWFRFCRVRDFGAPYIRPVLLPCAGSYGIIPYTRNITNISYRRDFGCAFNYGPDYHWLAPLVARPVPALKLVRHRNDVFVPGLHGNVFINAPRGNTLVVAAPPVLPGAPLAPVRGLPAVRAISAPRIDRGWAVPPTAPALAPVIRATIAQQTQGITPMTAPARPFQPALVSMVPKKVDLRASVVAPAPVIATQVPQTLPASAAQAVPIAPGGGLLPPQRAPVTATQPPTPAAVPQPPAIAAPGAATSAQAVGRSGMPPGLVGKTNRLLPSAPAAPAPVVAAPAATVPAVVPQTIRTPAAIAPAPAAAQKPAAAIVAAPPAAAAANSQAPVAAPAAASTLQRPGRKRDVPAVTTQTVPKIVTPAPPATAPVPAGPRTAPVQRAPVVRSAPPVIAQPPTSAPSGKAFHWQPDVQRLQQQQAAAAAQQQQAAAAAAAAARQQAAARAAAPAPQPFPAPAPRSFGHGVPQAPGVAPAGPGMQRRPGRPGEK
jgi:hypothetical protein